jgi:hypothetical protein
MVAESGCTGTDSVHPRNPPVEKLADRCRTDLFGSPTKSFFQHIRPVCREQIAILDTGRWGIRLGGAGSTRRGADGHNLDRFAFERRGDDIDYLDFLFSVATLRLVSELSGAFGSIRALSDRDFGNRDLPILNCCAIQSIYEALRSIADKRLARFLSGFARLNLCDLQAGRKPEFPLKSGWRQTWASNLPGEAQHLDNAWRLAN